MANPKDLKQKVNNVKIQKGNSWEIAYQDMAGNEVKLSPQIIRTYLLPPDSKATDQEIVMFLKLCQFQKLNPFLREVYLIKYGTYPASMVTGKETFTKRAKKDKSYRGHKVWVHDVVISNDKKIVEMQATAQVFVKDYELPIEVTVDYDEYVGKKTDGTINKQWQGKPKTMLKKCALVQALREAYPENFAGMYSQEEINTIDTEDLVDAPIDVPLSKEEPEEKDKEYGTDEQGRAIDPETNKPI